jgi:hypothetical protein
VTGAPEPDRSLAALEALLGSTSLVQRENVTAARTVTLAEIADGHIPQLEFMELCSEVDADGGYAVKNAMALCSRRAAKTTALMGLLSTDASEHDGFQLYFGKNKPAVRISIWERIWKPFCKKHFENRVAHADGPMVSRFATGAVVAFTGTDDTSHIENYLGGKFRRVVIDEVQSQKASVIDPLVTKILPPALSDSGGQMILAGTIPEVPAGIFYDLWMNGEGWLKRNWNRFQNPHLKNQLERLAEFLRASKHTMDDPLVRRDWFGELVFDSAATAYGYSVARNRYKPEEPEWVEKFLREFEGDPMFEHIRRTIAPKDGTCRNGVMAAVPHPGIEVYSAAVDPGAARDRFSISVHGWGTDTQEVQHVFEFSSERKANLKWSQIDPIRRIIEQMYGPSWWFYDAGGSKVVLDSFVGDTGLPALMPAVKSGLKGQVDRVSDIMLTGKLQVMEGSAAEED